MKISKNDLLNALISEHKSCTSNFKFNYLHNNHYYDNGHEKKNKY